MKPDKDLTTDHSPEPLLNDLRQLINAARERVARYVNQELTLLHWDVGQRVQVELLKNERAEYGKQT